MGNKLLFTPDLGPSEQISGGFQTPLLPSISIQKDKKHHDVISTNIPGRFDSTSNTFFEEKR